MYCVYILFSSRFNRYYIGSCEDIDIRLELHNTGKVRSTSPYRPWEVIMIEKFSTRGEALKREKQIKSYKRGMAFKRLLSRRGWLPK